MKKLATISKPLHKNEIHPQTDWSGGAVGEQVTSGATTTFATSSGVDYASTPGSIKLQQQ